MNSKAIVSSEKDSGSPLYAVMVDAKEPNGFDVLLVNPTSDRYTNIRMLSGGVQTVDDGLIETNKVFRDMGELAPLSSFFISYTDLDELEMSIWFQLDCFRSPDTAPEKYFFQLPRYLGVLDGIDKSEDATVDPIVKKKTLAIQIRPRMGETIESWVSQNSLESKYTKTNRD